jgi:hypothetical protein
MNSFTYEKVSTPQASKDTFFLFQVSFYWIMIIILWFNFNTVMGDHLKMHVILKLSLQDISFHCKANKVHRLYEPG